MSIHFELFNDECAIVKEAQDANLLSQESKLMHVILQLNWSPSKLTTPEQLYCLRRLVCAFFVCKAR